MAKITLSNGDSALVDHEDCQNISHLHWYLSGGVAVASFSDGRQLVVVSMPRFLLGLKTGDKRVVIHANGNKLDCRRSNIKIKTRSDVMAGSKQNARNKSGYRGVSEVNNGAWRAQIASGNTQYYLGTFKTAKEASAAYKMAEKELNKLKKAKEASMINNLKISKK